jgi:hypothetical protein
MSSNPKNSDYGITAAMISNASSRRSSRSRTRKRTYCHKMDNIFNDKSINIGKADDGPWAKSNLVHYDL